VEDKVVVEFDATLVVAVEGGCFVYQMYEILQQSSNLNGFT
jgi:hypothetical protein